MSRLRALRLLPLLLAAVVAGGAAGAVEARPVATAPNDAAMEKLERIVRARVDSRRTTGIVAGMVFPDGETRVFAYGSAGGGKRLTASSVFEIGSITKVFTATVQADMVQRREVRLTDPVSSLLPRGDVRLTDPVSSLLPPNVKVPSRNGRAITLEDLATHSSGLPREATNLRPKNENNPFAGYDAAKLYAFLKVYKLPRDPERRSSTPTSAKGSSGTRSHGGRARATKSSFASASSRRSG